MHNRLLLVLTLSLVLGVFSISEAYAEIDYDEIEIQSTSTVYFETSNSKIIVATIQLTNNANEEFSSWNNIFQLVTSGNYYDLRDSFDLDVGDKVCPGIVAVPASGSNEMVLCFEIPKSLPNSSFTLELRNQLKSFCDDFVFTECQVSSKSIKSPLKENYDEYVKKFILKNTDIKVDFNSIDLIEQPGFNILKIDFDVTNLSANKVEYYNSNIFAFTPDGTSYTSERYDLTNVGYSGDECKSYGIEINPKLTKSHSYCFEVPQGINIFDLSIREGNFDDCSGLWNDCIEYVLNISNPNFVALNQPTPDPVDTTPQETPQTNSPSVNDENKIQELERKIKELESANKKLQNTIDELQEKLTQTGDSTPKIKKEIASFVDKTKDPQSYVDRYKNESSYKEWFDENYPDYDSIYEAVGKRQPVPDWIKNNAIWWSEGKLSEDEFVGGIEYLVKSKIINVN